MRTLTSALCVTALTCATAHAQSNVTVFGIADVNLARGSGSLSKRTQLASGANASSRVGVRGQEDLGGGLSASFWLEAQVNVDNGTGVGTNTNNQASGNGPALAGSQGLVFNRRSTVSVAGRWGELRLGRDYTGHYRNRVDTDPFGVVGVGASQVNVGSLAGTTSTRASNAVGYFLPALPGGLYGSVQYYLGENASGTPTADDGRGYSLRLGSKIGPVDLSGAYARQDLASGDIVSRNLGAIYRHARFQLSAGWFQDTTHSATPFSGKGYLLGAIVPLGTGELKLALTRYGSDAGAQPTTRKLALGYVHNLSRRTALYGTWARVSNSGGATTALNGSTTAANAGSSGFDLGIRHSF